jgi:hypothetical protein
MSNSPPEPGYPDPNRRAPAIDDTDHLLDAAARGDNPGGNPLAALLTAAATPDPDDALAGEEAAVAKFRAAQRPAPGVWRRALRAAAAAALAALTLGGVAFAADQVGLSVPLFHHNPTPSPQSSPSTRHSPTPPAATTPTSPSTPATRSGAVTPHADRRGPARHASRGRTRVRNLLVTPQRDPGSANRDKQRVRGPARPQADRGG